MIAAFHLVEVSYSVLRDVGLNIIASKIHKSVA